MKKFLLSSLFLIPLALYAKIELPSVISDNMVLQQNSSVAVWGKASPLSKVVIKTGWDKVRTVVKSDGEGNWKARINTPSAGGPYEMTISDGDKVTLRDILIGEVWYCGGQSNMEYQMMGYSSRPVNGGLEEIACADPQSQIRIFKTPLNMSCAPSGEIQKTSWKKTTPESVAECSAVAYFFAKQLQNSLRVPVGILCCHAGGTPIETWMPRQLLEKEFPGEFDDDFSYQAEDGPKEWLKHWPLGAASICYNGMVNTIAPYTFKGMLWYQGCSNLDEPAQYKRLQYHYVKFMRELFEVPDAAFCFCGIAPYPRENGRAFKSGYFREAQRSTLETIPNSYMISTIDLGDYYTIHPLEKKEVGFRLCLMALDKVYDFECFDFKVPKVSQTIDGDGKITLTFDAELRYEGFDCPLNGFEIAGSDRIFKDASASIVSTHTVRVWSLEVGEPVAVRYCFRNWSVGNLYLSYGMPSDSFRTDIWDDLIE